MKNAVARFALVIALVLGIDGSALAGQHTWDVNEVFSDSTGQIQFVELWEAAGGAGEVNIHTLSVTSNTESFPIGGSALTPPTTNKFFLIATPAFAALPGAPTPDRILPPGNIPFFSTAGDTVSFVPYDSWNFGTVPTDGVNSLKRLGGPPANSPTNYAGQTGQVDAGSPAPSVPALNGLGIGLVAGLLVLAGIAIARRRTAAA
jgi:hypothetical protein